VAAFQDATADALAAGLRLLREGRLLALQPSGDVRCGSEITLLGRYKVVPRQKQQDCDSQDYVYLRRRLL
jgi:hypothetical protein